MQFTSSLYPKIKSLNKSTIDVKENNEEKSMASIFKPKFI